MRKPTLCIRKAMLWKSKWRFCENGAHKKKAFLLFFAHLIHNFDFVEGTHVRKSKRKGTFLLFFAHLIHTLTSSKVLTFGKAKEKGLSFCFSLT